MDSTRYWFEFQSMRSLEATTLVPEAREIGEWSSPFSLPGWVEFNETRWGLKAEHWNSTGATLQTVLYADRRGRFKLPRLNHYVPIRFCPTETSLESRRQRQWEAGCSELAAAMRARGLANVLPLSPGVTDVRPWQWQGFRTTVQYTCVVKFPFVPETADPAVRKSIRKAMGAGYYCSPVRPDDRFLECLAESEQRQGFAYGITRMDLELADRLLTPECLRLYACFDRTGDLAAARAVLHSAGAYAVDWLVGSRTAHLSSGATQLLISFVLGELQDAGAAGLDFEGANLRTVAAAKLNWAARLVPIYTLEARNLKTLARDLLRWREAGR